MATVDFRKTFEIAYGRGSRLFSEEFVLCCEWIVDKVAGKWGANPIFPAHFFRGWMFRRGVSRTFFHAGISFCLDEELSQRRKSLLAI